MKQSEYIAILDLLFENSRVIEFNTNITMQICPSTNAIRDLLYNYLKDDYDSETDFFQHDSMLLSSDSVTDLQVIINRITAIQVFGLAVFYNKEHFLQLNKLQITSSTFYILNEKYISSNLPNIEPQWLNGFNNYLIFISIFTQASTRKLTDYEYFFNDENNNDKLITIDKACLLSDSIKKIEAAITRHRTNTVNYIDELLHIISCNLCFASRKYNTSLVSDLCTHIDEITDGVLRDYHLFISGFSFTKIKNDFIHDKSRYIEVIDKYIATIQNIVFSIPISIGLTILIQLVNSSSKVNSLILSFSFVFYTAISIIIIFQNNTSVEITKAIISNERKRLIEISSCNDIVKPDNDFSIFFDLFTKKINLIKTLSIITVVSLVLLSTIFIFKLIIMFPDIHDTISTFTKTTNNNLLIKSVKWLVSLFL